MMERTFVLTVPMLRARPWTEALQREGLRWVHWPLSEISRAPGLCAPTLHARIAANTWTLLPSPSAVILLMQALAQAQLSWPSGSGIGLIGPGSRGALMDWLDQIPGLREAPLLIPAQPPFDAAALIDHPDFADPGRVRGMRVLVLHRPDGQDRWLRTLVSRGARLEVLALYRQATLGLDAHALKCLASEAAQTARDAQTDQSAFLLSVASRNAGLALLRSAEAMGLRAWLTQQVLLTHHPAIAQAMQEAGFRQVHLHAPGVEACIAKVRTLESREPSSS